jgi:hypothetical protein
LDALKPIEKILDEANKALQDSNRTTESSDIPEILAAAAGVGTGGVISFAALFYGGSVTGLSAAGITSGLATAGSLIGGGMVAGIGVLAAPAVALGIGGYAVISRKNRKKLIERKEMLLQQAIRKCDAILADMRKEVNNNRERSDYLQSLITILKSIIKDLQADLAT